jgi:hypothetical protein
MMDARTLRTEAHECRAQAIRYLGKPEAPFLLRIASEFERLAEEKLHVSEPNGDPRYK